MLILHGSSDILVPHCPHHRRQIAGVAEDPRPIIVSCAIQDKILGGVGPSGVRFGIAFPCPSDSELLSHAHQMTTPRTSGRKQPFRLTCSAGSELFVCAIAHRDHSSPIDNLAVWYEDDSIVPIQVFRTDTIKLSPVPHSRVLLARMMTSRNSSNISGFQWQDLAAVSNFSSSITIQP